MFWGSEIRAGSHGAIFMLNTALTEVSGWWPSAGGCLV